ncbi:Syntaxin-16 [Caligus rogercresseyi]|uniref:Syntaxin-16 n=1 Tax=Caligus rogercresseyi TaxID=217165 RepID=A0A7T8KKT0_CALRO|nr:Syntaxin-16 [Caligus rogercresseyi]
MTGTVKLPARKCYYKDFVVMRNNAIQRKRFQNEQVQLDFSGLELLQVWG